VLPPTESAKVVALLASPCASFVTGAIVAGDGGSSAIIERVTLEGIAVFGFSEGKVSSF